jgi:hypothetical protein
MAIAGAVCCYKMADYGGGKHIWDPVFKNPNNLTKYLRFLWMGQLLNLYGMAVVKLSICAYIFMLNFSKSFRALIWVSVVVHIGLNFVFPTIILFGECTPYTKHWDALGTQPGHCWSTKPKVISGMRGFTTHTVILMLKGMNRIHGCCYEYCDRPLVHYHTTGLYLTRTTEQAYSVGGSHCVLAWSHVSPLLCTI